MIDSKDYKPYKVYCVYGPDDSETMFNVKASSYEGAKDIAFDILEEKGLDRAEAQQLLDEGYWDHYITIEAGAAEKTFWGNNYFEGRA